MRYIAFIRSSIKKYNFIDKNKDILKPIKYKREGKLVWWKIDLRLALYLIIITLQTQVITWTAQKQYKTIFNLYRDDGPYYIISGILISKFYIDRLEIGYLIKIVK